MREKVDLYVFSSKNYFMRKILLRTVGDRTQQNRFTTNSKTDASSYNT